LNLVSGIRRRAGALRRTARERLHPDNLFCAGPRTLEPYGRAGEAAMVATSRKKLRDEERGALVDCVIRRPAASASPAPVVVYSVPSDWYPKQPSPAAGHLTRYLAASGYAVVTVRHVTSDRILFPQWVNEAADPRAYVSARLADPAVQWNRTRDIRLVLDHLEAGLERQGEGLDLDRIGVCGHSIGAVTALELAGLGGRASPMADGRIKAVIAYSSAGLGGGPAGVDLPACYFTGSRDHLYHARQRPEDSLRPFRGGNAPGQYAVLLRGADHDTFGGMRAEALTAGRREQLCHQWIRSISLAFWDGWLREDAAARRWLDDDLQRLLGRDGRFWQR
jgi:dienelactone hydrolase